MRREFSQARGLFVAQAQMLHAHDEIKCATSRLRLKLTDDEPPAIDVLSKDELIPSSMQFTSDKFSGLSSLTRIRGQLRYLKVRSEVNAIICFSLMFPYCLRCARKT